MKDKKMKTVNKNMAKIKFIPEKQNADPQLFIDGKKLELNGWDDCLYYIVEKRLIPVFLYNKRVNNINIPLSDMSDEYGVKPHNASDKVSFTIRKSSDKTAIVRFWFVAYEYSFYDPDTPGSFILLKDVDMLREYLLKDNVELHFLNIEYNPRICHEVVMIIEIYIDGDTLDDINQKARKFDQIIDSFHKYIYYKGYGNNSLSVTKKPLGGFKGKNKKYILKTKCPSRSGT